MRQLALLPIVKSGRGGARVGAGRPRRAPALRHTAHRARPPHRAAHPVHVTLRSVCRSLRSQFIARCVLRALRDSQRRSFRIVHYSVQDNHLHLLVEADSRPELLSGMRSLVVRVARRLNQVLFRRGPFWADRWHSRALMSPREVRNALVYVLQNRAKHSATHTTQLDPLSSAAWFDGFASPVPPGFCGVAPQANAPPRSWLLRVGWRRHSLIGLKEAPRR